MNLNSPFRMLNFAIVWLLTSKLRGGGTNPTEKAELSATIEEEERKFRRRSVGTVTFIGEGGGGMTKMNRMFTSEVFLLIKLKERKFRRRSVGTVTFIGELYKIGMLTSNIINICITSLLDPNSEDKLECMCKLLTTVGRKYDETTQPMFAKKDGPQQRLVNLDNIVRQMQDIANKKVASAQQISSRVRFMLQDIRRFQGCKYPKEARNIKKSLRIFGIS
uniref:MIF4G domain-containing protein n=1 Tax=Megaselia scalaris TaxID=36166 RepID=T1GXK1_MEGSC